MNKLLCLSKSNIITLSEIGRALFVLTGLPGAKGINDLGTLWKRYIVQAQLVAYYKTWQSAKICLLINDLSQLNGDIEFI